MNLGAQLFRAARESLNMTQVEVGERVGSTHNEVSNWERGIAKPGRTKSVAIARLPQPQKGRWPTPGDWDEAPREARKKASKPA